MISMTSDSEDMMFKNSEDSPLDDANSGRNVGGNVLLKKGPWTTAEDAILVEYVTKHGEGNWNAVQKHTGLARCGKSCRLRWANHLRPDLKKGAFTLEEERLIIELHAKMGNKWARMAAELPGRTDNEIKNYWNTRIKRRQRAGLPIYPPDLCVQSLNENQQSDDGNAFLSMDAQPNILPVNNLDPPQFKGFDVNQQFCSSRLVDIPGNGLLPRGLYSSYPNGSLLPTTHQSKRLQGSLSVCHGLCPGISNLTRDGSQYYCDDSFPSTHYFKVSSEFGCDSTSYNASSSSPLPGSHAVLNGNPSTSEPDWAMKLELPSLQTEMGSWGSPSTPLPSLESVDTLIQTPPNELCTASCDLSTQNSGLLEAVLYESQAMKISKNSHQQASRASDMDDDKMDTSSQDLQKTEWEAYGESVSSLNHSSSPVFAESTLINGNSWDEHQYMEFMPGDKDTEASHLVYDERTNMIFSRPDFLLASNGFLNKNHINGHSLLTTLNWDTSWP